MIPGTIRLPVTRWPQWARLETDAATTATWWAPRWLRFANFALLFITTRGLADPNLDAIVTLNRIPTRRRAVTGIVAAVAMVVLTYRYAPVQTWTPIFLVVIWSFVRDLARAQTGWHLSPGGDYLANYLRHPAAARGTGQPLMEAICAHADSGGHHIALHVRPGNEALIRLYKSYGFDDQGIGWNNRLVMVRPAS